MKFDHEIRSSHNALQLTLRALQFATTSPQGPAYMMASREALEGETAHPEASGAVKPTQQWSRNKAAEDIGLLPSAVEELATVLAGAERPLVVTGYVGRTPAGFEALAALAGLLAVPVHENAAICNNFSTKSFLHQGLQWNLGGQNPALAEADVVLVVDADVPWIPSMSKPGENARVYHLDSDPLKTSMTLWSLPCEKRWQCESSLALGQVYSFLKGSNLVAEAAPRIQAREAFLKERFQQRRAKLLKAESLPSDGVMTVPYLMACFRESTAGLPVVVLNETTTNMANIANHLDCDAPRRVLGSGGGGLGWWSGAAVGAHMALQAQGRDDLLAAFVGDGTFLFGVPSSAYWMARKYNTPFLTVVLNNGGWAAPRAACLRVHGELAAQADLTEALGVGITPSPAFGKIAEGAGDAWSATVERPEEAGGLMAEAVRVVREERRCALLEVRIRQI